MSDIMGDWDKIEQRHIYNLDATLNGFPRDAFDSNNDSAFIVKDTEENKKRWRIILKHNSRTVKSYYFVYEDILKFPTKRQRKKYIKKMNILALA